MDDNAFDIHIFDPSAIHIFRPEERSPRVRMTLGSIRSWHDVHVACAFPFSDPHHYIGLRDGEGNDIGIIEDPALLDRDSRAIVEEELDRRYFTPKVERVLSVTEQMGTVTWDVETDRGRRHFVVRNIRDNSFPLGQNRLMVTDSDGNRYEFPDVNKYGARAYQVLAKVI